jgi:hypothetical protein
MAIVVQQAMTGERAIENGRWRRRRKRKGKGYQMT